MDAVPIRAVCPLRFVNPAAVQLTSRDWAWQAEREPLYLAVQVRDNEPHIVRRLCIAETSGERDDFLRDVLVLALELGSNAFVHGPLFQIR
jgi:hypothetical protein